MLISEELTLPCGLTLPNRLVKAALAEDMAPSHIPGEEFPVVYGEWADGGWGMVLTGNAQVSNMYLGTPRDVTVAASPESKKAWKAWATVSQKNGTPTLVQLNHPGRQSIAGAGRRSLWSKNIAPSAVKLVLGPRWIDRAIAAAVFGTPRAMTSADIEDVIRMFVDGAKLAEEAGFPGVQLHAAHGYLFSQFMSPVTNLRTDEFGGTPAKRVEILLRVLQAIRTATSPRFCIGIKMNSVDASGSDSLEDVLEQIRLIVDCGIDFIEISGGTYEDPRMVQERAAPEPTKSERTIARESFFLQFSESVRERFPKVVLMVTGGFRTRTGMEKALASGACDLIGMGRPATVLPRLPKEIILNEQVKDEEADVRLKDVVLPWWVGVVGGNVAGAGERSKYYAGQIHRIAKGQQPVDSRILIKA